MIVILSGLIAADWWLEQQPVQSHADQDLRFSGLGQWKAILVVIILLPLLWKGYGEFHRIATGNQAGTIPFAGLTAMSFVAILPWLESIQSQLAGIGHQTRNPYYHAFYLLVQLLIAQPLVTLGVLLGWLFLWQMIRHKLDQAFVRVGATTLGVCYLGLGGAAILLLRLKFGPAVLVLFLAAVKCTDIGAYFSGSFLGKHKLAPWLSPGKSVEGLLGGLVAAAGICCGCKALAGLDSLSGLNDLTFLREQTWLAMVVLGVLIGLAGQFGDLCESLLKRSAGEKDSGRVLPQFGGVLDIIDSPLLAAPVAYLLIAGLQSL